MVAVPRIDARRLFVLALLGLVLSAPAAAGCNGEDPDPCDPDCPPTTENPSGN